MYTDCAEKWCAIFTLPGQNAIRLKICYAIIFIENFWIENFITHAIVSLLLFSFFHLQKIALQKKIFFPSFSLGTFFVLNHTQEFSTF